MPVRNNLYLFGPILCDYDEYSGFVVAAPDAQTAIDLCNANSDQKWDDAPITFLGLADLEINTGIVLGSFNAG